MRRIIGSVAALALLLSGCAQRETETEPTPTAPTFAPGGSANVTFRAASDQAELSIRFPVFWGTNRMPSVAMMRDAGTFSATVPFPRGALIQYQYHVPTLDYEHREQYQSGEEPLRHLLVEEDVVVEDAVYAFDRETVPRPSRVFGRVTDAATGQPVLEPWLSVDGILVSALDGDYEADVRERPTRVTVFTLDGSHKPQTRVVSPGRADFQLQPATPARVTIRADADAPEHHQVRVYGSAIQFGLIQTYLNRYLHETYTTLDGDLVLDLYDGQWVDYLYTVGNAVMSYEHRDAEPVVRSFIARDGLVVDDEVGSFVQEGSTTFRVTTPAYTDPREVIGIQYLDPRLLHMHPAGEHEWVLLVSGPTVEGRPYRYLRTWTGVGDETTVERVAHGATIEDAVASWKTQSGPVASQTFPTPTVTNKFRLVPFLPDWWSAQHALLQVDMTDQVASEGLHGFLPAQVWGYERFEPTVKIRVDRPMTLYTPQFEMARIVRLAHAKGLVVAVTPQLVMPDGNWPGHVFPADWWPGYLDQIERFNGHMARSAAAAGVDELEVVGKSPYFTPPADYVDDYDAKMESIVDAVRALFPGRVFAQYDEYLAGADWWRKADAIMQLSYNPGLDGNATQAQIDARIEEIFETKYRAQYEAAGKPLIIKLAAHAVDGAMGGREVPEADGAASERNHRYPLDVEEQRMIYEAYYEAATKRTWVDSVFPFVHGYTVGPDLRDVDIHGKPADALTSAWAKAMR